MWTAFAEVLTYSGPGPAVPLQEWRLRNRWQGVAVSMNGHHKTDTGRDNDTDSTAKATFGT